MGVVRVALALLALSTTRAAADEFVLMIENSAGAVVTLEGRTHKECDAAVALLNPVHDLPTVVADPNGGGVIISRSWSGVTVSAQDSSKIVKARCFAPSNAK